MFSPQITGSGQQETLAQTLRQTNVEGTEYPKKDYSSTFVADASTAWLFHNSLYGLGLISHYLSYKKFNIVQLLT